MHKKTLFLAAACLAAAAVFADPAEDVGRAGDDAWNKLIAAAESAGTWEEPVGAAVVCANFPKYDGKLMRFPKIDFGDFVTDRDGRKYYWYGEKSSYNLFVVKYDDGIQDQLRKLSAGFGKPSGEYEVIGRITDAYSWWGKVVEMEVAAMRIPGSACVVMEDGKPSLVGKEIFENWMASKAATWTAGIPQDAKSVPAGLGPEDVAKWFLYYGSVKKDDSVWKQLCSVEENAVSASGSLQAKGTSWWRMISKGDREYYFVRAASDKDTAQSRTFMYQIKLNGADNGTAKPIKVVKEKSGEWRVASF